MAHRQNVQQAHTIVQHKCDCGCGQFILALRDRNQTVFAVAAFEEPQFNALVRALLDLSNQGFAGHA